MLSGVLIAVCILVSSYTTQGSELVSQFEEATQSSTHDPGVASRAVDGGTNGDYFKESCTHTATGVDNPWWYLNLGSHLLISKIVVYNRNDCCGERLIGAVVRVGNNNVSTFTGNTQCGSDITSAMVGSNPIEMTCSPAIAGKYVSVYLPGSDPLSLCEVQLYKDLDVENPTITCPNNITVNTGVDQSMNPVTWSDPDVMDNVDTGLMATCTPSSGSSFEVGLTKVTCSVTDASGNEGNCSFFVNIEDVEKPIITCPNNITVSTGVDQSLNPVTWSDPNVMDNVDTGMMATCTPSSGSSFDVGLTKVTCSATDASGNEGNCSFFVNIEAATTPYQFEATTQGHRPTTVLSSKDNDDKVSPVYTGMKADLGSDHGCSLIYSGRVMAVFAIVAVVWNVLYR